MEFLRIGQIEHFYVLHLFGSTMDAFIQSREYNVHWFFHQHTVVHCMVHWLPRLAANSKGTSTGTSLVVCCKTFLVVVSRYMEPLQVYRARWSDTGWAESEVGGRTMPPTELVVDDGVGDTSNGSESCKAIQQPAPEDILSNNRALYLTRDLHAATKTVWSILLDCKHSSFPDVATTCGMLYIALLRATHVHCSKLSKTCHQLLKVDGEEVDKSEL